MDATDRFYLIMAGIIAGALTAIILGGMMLYTSHRQAMAKAGMQQQLIPGTGGTIWVRAGSPAIAP